MSERSEFLSLLNHCDDTQLRIIYERFLVETSRDHAVFVGELAGHTGGWRKPDELLGGWHALKALDVARGPAVSLERRMVSVLCGGGHGQD